MHDPSQIVQDESGTYWFFGTGHGVTPYQSEDMESWTAGSPVMEPRPDWITDVAADQEGHFWAPSIVKHGDTYRLYYSVSSFGKNTSAIALATAPSLAEENPEWTDQGIVVRSEEGDSFNAIDPAVFEDEEGRWWMTFGSYWSGIQLIELDPETGKRISPDSEMHRLATHAQIEAPYITFHDGYYYLFVNQGLCCRGVDSTYEIAVGRSRSVTGPYVDREGQDLIAEGGTLVVGREGSFIGPGHAGLYEDDQGRLQMTMHFYDGANDGQPTLAIRELTWGEDGWPTVEPVPEP